ncbi:MAG: hypothetical protein R6V47_03965 [Candidatus Delongbacteria bacterium]
MEKMGVFSGKYKYSLDEKGRINFKKILKRFNIKKDTDDENSDKNETFHLLKDYVRSLKSDNTFPVFYIFTSKTWSQFYEEAESEMDDDKLSAFTTLQCDEAALDNLYRITFPKEFLEYIKASKNLFIQGLGDKLQVWSRENFDEYSKDMSSHETANDFHGILNKRKKRSLKQ